MEQKLDQHEFKTYPARLTELTPRQHRKLLDALRVKENAGVVAEPLINGLPEADAALIMKMRGFTGGGEPTACSDTAVKAT